MRTKGENLSVKEILKKLSVHDDASFALQSLDKNGKFLYVNQVWRKMTGYSSKDIAGKSFSNVLTGKNKKIFKKRFEEFVKLGQVEDVRFQLLKKNKEIMEAAFEGRFFYSKRREPIYTECILRDISEDVNRMEELKNSEEKFKVLFENAPDAMYLIDSNLCFTDINKAAEKLSGYNREEVLGKKLMDIGLLTKDSEQLAIKSLTKNLKGYASGPEVYTLLTKENKKIEIEVMDYSVNIDDEKCILGIARNIDDRQKFLEKIKENEEKYRILFESSQDALMTLEPPGWKFTSGNQATLNLFGLQSEEEFISLSPVDLSPKYQPDGRLSSEKAKLMIANAMKRGSYFFEWTHKRYQGENFEATVLLTKVKIGKREFVQSNVRDVSAQKKAEAEILASREKFASLFNSMAEGVAIHELIYKNGKPNDYKILDVNPAFEKVLGLKKSDIIGLNSRKAYQTTKPPYLDVYRQVALTGKMQNFETYFSPLKKYFQISVVSNEKNKFYTIFSDITDRKEYDKKIASIAKFPEENPSPVFRLSDSGLVLYANSAAQKLDPGILKPGKKLPFNLKKYSQDIFKTKKNKIFENEINGKIYSFTSVPVREKKYVNIYAKDISDLKESQNNILRERDIAKKYFEMAGSLMVVLDKNGKIRQINRKACEVLGYHEDELIGKDWISAVVPSELKDVVRNVFTQTVKSGGIYPEYFENEIVNKKGKRILIAWHNSSERDSQGNLQFVLSSGEDITEKKASQKKLLNTKERFSRAIYDSPYPIMIYNEDGEVIMISKAWAEISGYRFKDIHTTKLWSEKALGKKKFDTRQIINNLYVANKKIHEGEINIKTKTGENRTWDLSLIPMGLDDDGKRLAMSMGADVTLRKNITDELRRSQQIAKMGRWRFDIKEDMLSWSDESYEVFGIEKKDFNGNIKAFFDLVHPEDLQGVKDAYAKSLETREPYDIIHRVITTKGEIKYIREICDTFYDNKNKAITSVGISQDVTEIKQAENTLKEKNETNKKILENSPFGVFVINSLGTADYVNKAMLDISAASKKRFLKINFLSHENYIKYGISKKIQDALENSVGFEMKNIKYKSTEGEKTTVRNFIGVPIQELGSKKVVMFIEDLSDLAEKQKEIKDSRDFYLTLLDDFPALVWRSGVNGKLDYFNSTWIEYTGLMKGQAVYDGWKKCVHPDDLKMVTKVHSEIFKSRNKYKIEYRLRRFDGKYRLIKEWGRPIFGLNNEYIGFIGSGYDIQDEKDKEEKILNASNEWTSTFDAMADGISIHTKDFTIVSANKTLCEMYNKTKEELEGKKCFIVLNMSECPDTVCPMKKVITDRKRSSFEAFDENIKKWVFVELIPIIEDNGKVEKVIHTVRDITERKKNEQEIKERNEQLEKFNNLAVGREIKMIEMKKELDKYRNKK